MRKIVAATAVAALSLPSMATVMAGPASAAAMPSSQDITWMKSNAQTDLAEISLGTLVMSKSASPNVLSLAKVTKTQHEQALAKLKSLAKSLKVTLPSAPSPMQKSQASQLSSLSGSSFNLTYDNDQIAGHELSIAQTQTEISSGSDPTVISFAKYYLPIAQMHLQMAQTLHTELTSTPSGAMTGTGGGADRSSPPGAVLLGIAVVGGLGAVAAAWRLRRA